MIKKKSILLMLLIMMQTIPMEQIIPKNPSQAKFYKQLKRFDLVDDSICATKDYSLISKQRHILYKMRNKLFFAPLQTIANYTLYNAELSKIIAHSIAQFSSEEKNSSPTYNFTFLYKNLVSAKDALLRLTKEPTYFSEIESYALNELSIGVHLILMRTSQEDFYYLETVKELTLYLDNCLIIYNKIIEQKKIII